MTTSHPRLTQSSVRHLPASNDTEEIRRCINHVYSLIYNNRSETSTQASAANQAVSSQAVSPVQNVSSGWWQSIVPPIGLLNIDASGNLVLDAQGRATIRAVLA